LFCGVKAKEEATFKHVAAEDAEEFDQTMRDPRSDVYACLVGFVSHSGSYSPETPTLPPQYAGFEDVASENDSKDLPLHTSNNLAIHLTEGTSPPY
jgi:hypothetical protein